MLARVDLWQKSLGPVIEITGVSAVDCDVYHDPTCDPALRQETPEPSIPTCPLSQIPQFVLSERLDRPRNGLPLRPRRDTVRCCILSGFSYARCKGWGCLLEQT